MTISIDINHCDEECMAMEKGDKMKNAAKTIDSYLPKKDSHKMLVQAKLSSDLHAQVKKCMDVDGITWQDLIVASLKRYLDERKA